MKKVDLENAFAQYHAAACKNCLYCVSTVIRVSMAAMLYDEE